jgi:hypothetical protein
MRAKRASEVIPLSEQGMRHPMAAPSSPVGGCRSGAGSFWIALGGIPADSFPHETRGAAKAASFNGSVSEMTAITSPHPSASYRRHFRYTASTLGLTAMRISRAIRDALLGGPPYFAPETWTPEVHRVFRASVDAAERMKHDFLAPEHLLLGLLSRRGNTVCRVLSGAGFDVDELEAAAEARASDLQRDRCGPTSEFWEVLRQAVEREQRRLRHHYCGTEALFLGLLACDASGAQWLCARGLDYSRAQNLLDPKKDVRAQEQTAQPGAPGNDAPPGSLPTTRE